MSGVGRRGLALFGRETRYVGRIYLLRVFLVLAGALSVVLALDLALNFEALARGDIGAAATEDTTARMAYYVWLRLLYNLPQALPIAAAVGVVWAEFSLARSRERLMIAATGRTPLLSLVPALVMGLVLGLVQVSALTTLRPHAVEAQATGGYRNFGPRFRGAETAQPEWIMTDRALVHARIGFAEPAHLIEVTAYLLDDGDRIGAIIGAARAEPAGAPGHWRFTNGSVWRVDRAENLPAETFETLVIPFGLDPVWLSHAGVPARFLPQPVLASLASGRGGIPQPYRYAANYHQRFAGPLYLAAMAVLGATLGLLLLSPRVSLGVPLVIGMSGYCVHVSVQIIWTLGEFGLIGAAWAAWTLPVVLLAGCIGWLAWLDLQVRRRLAAGARARAGG